MSDPTTSLIPIPALVPLTSLSELWIDDRDSDTRWVMVTAKHSPMGRRSWFGLDRTELARVLFTDAGMEQRSARGAHNPEDTTGFDSRPRYCGTRRPGIWGGNSR